VLITLKAKGKTKQRGLTHHWVALGSLEKGKGQLQQRENSETMQP